MNIPEQQVRRWLEQVVIGLNLCPFAATPYRRKQILITTSGATDEEALLGDLQKELKHIDRLPTTQLETTLLVIPHLLADFDDYNQFLDLAEALLGAGGWVGDYQLASFHPHYRFEGTEPDDPGNLTNRSPYPILHILREASLERMLANHPDPDAIPRRNIRRMESLSAEQRQALFPYL